MFDLFRSLWRRVAPGESAAVSALAHRLRGLPEKEVPKFWYDLAERNDGTLAALAGRVGGFSGTRLGLDEARFSQAYSVVRSLIRHHDLEGLKAFLGGLPDGNRLVKPLHGDWVDIMFPPLVTAVQTKAWAVLPWLLERGANARTGDKSGHTPLHGAVDKDFEPMWRLVLAASDANASNDDGDTAAHVLARGTNFADPVAAARARQRWKDLRVAGFRSSARNSKGETVADLLQARGLPDFDALIAEHEAIDLTSELPAAASSPRPRVRL